MNTGKGNSAVAGVTMTHVTTKAVSERQIFLILQTVCTILVQRLLKISEVPALNT